MNAVARTADIYIQELQNEVVLYDKASHQAHCLNETVFKIWQNADGTKSVDELAELLNRDLRMACSRDVVVLALEDLRNANLLQSEAMPAGAQLPSRRDVAKKLSMAGLSASLLPFVASMVAPTPAMARSGEYSKATFEQEYNKTMSEAKHDLWEIAENKNGSLNDLTAALSDGEAGITASNHGKQATAQTDFANAQTEFDDMLKALGLPPL